MTLAKKRKRHSDGKHAASRAMLTGLPNDTHVAFEFRGAKGTKSPHGEIAGTTTGGTRNDPMEVIRPDPTSRHPGESKFVHRRRSNVRVI